MKIVVGVCFLLVCSSTVFASSDIKYSADMYQADMVNMISSLGRLHRLCESTGSKKICSEVKSMSRVMSVLAATKAAESWEKKANQIKNVKSTNKP